MNSLLKTILILRSNDKGVVLPVIIALGLIMTLVGTISIVQSNEEEITAKTQRKTAKALAAAELGVARYRELIDKYRLIATYPACINWSGNTCSDSGGDLSWGNVTAIKDDNNNELIGQSCPNDGSTVVPDLTNKTWQTVSGQSGLQYRLIEYTYANNVGQLVVEGKADNATTRLQVDIPVQPGIPTPNGETVELEGNFNYLNPALWIMGTPGSNSINASVTDVRKLTVNGNILLTDTNCELDSSNLPTTANLQDSSTQSIIVEPTQPQPGYKPLPVDASVINDINADDISDGITLPRTGDKVETVGSDKYYHYRVSNKNVLLVGDDLNIVAGSKVILYLQKRLILEGLPDPDGGGPLEADPVNINFRPNGNDSTNLEIYSLNQNANRIVFRGTGDINVRALIHAPNAQVRVNNQPKVTVEGAMWVKDWDGNNNANTSVVISPDNPANGEETTDQYYNYTYVRNDWSDTDAKIVNPVIASPSRWETQEAE